MKRFKTVILLMIALLTMTMMISGTVFAAPLDENGFNDTSPDQIDSESNKVSDEVTNELNPSMDMEDVNPGSLGPDASKLNTSKNPVISVDADGLSKTTKVSPSAVDNIKSQTKNLSKTDSALALWNTIGLSEEDLSGHNQEQIEAILECESLSATQVYYLELMDESGNTKSVQVTENEYNDANKRLNGNTGSELLTTRGSQTAVSGSWTLISSITQYKTHNAHAAHLTWNLGTPNPGASLYDSPLTIALATTDSQITTINNCYCRLNPRSSSGSAIYVSPQAPASKTSNYGASCKFKPTVSNSSYSSVTVYLEVFADPKTGSRSTQIDTSSKICKSVLYPTISFALEGGKWIPSFGATIKEVELKSVHTEATTGSWFGSAPNWRYSFNHGNEWVKSDWIPNGSSWYWLNKDGYTVRGWELIGSLYFFFDANCIMQTGWIKPGATWYYLRTAKDNPLTGAMGGMCTGWAKIGSWYYYFRPSDNTPIAGPLGGMCTGWIKVGSSWYYLNTATNTPASGRPEGAMLSSGNFVINGKTYNFNSSGVCTNPNI